MDAKIERIEALVAGIEANHNHEFMQEDDKEAIAILDRILRRMKANGFKRIYEVKADDEPIEL